MGTKNLVLGVSIGLAGAVALQTCLNNGPGIAMNGSFPISLNLDLQDSSEGRIVRIYSSINPTESKLEEAAKVGEFFDAQMIVFTDRELKTNYNVTIVPIETVRHSWMRDLFLFTDEAILTMPLATTSLTNSWISQKRLARQLEETMQIISIVEGLDMGIAPLRFEGGQILKTEQGVFVPDAYADSRWIMPFMFNGFEIQKLAFPERCCDELYQELFSTRAIYLPNLVVTDNYPQGRMMYSGHIDMIMMPGVEGKWLVADPDLGDKLWNEANEIDKNRFVSNLNKINSLETRMEIEIDGVYQYHMGKEVRQNLRDNLEFMENNFDVVRVPYPVILLNGEHIGLAYTNALVEEDRGKAVFASYGIPLIDNAAADAFSEAGFTEQLRVDGTLGLLTKSGPHCDYLERRE
jgi:hypothetical protein